MNRFFSAELEISDVQASYLPEDDLSASDSDAVDSDVEFHLYSQLHYSSSYYEGDSQENNIVTPLLNDEDVTDSESDDNDDEIDGKESSSEREDELVDKVGPFKREDISLLKDYLNKEEEEDFVPESWEIIDSVNDEDDGMVDIHIHDSMESLSDDEESGKGDMSPSKGCWKIDDRDRHKLKQDTKGRYYSDTPNSRQRCRNCNEVGHLARECPEAKKQPVCFMCGGRGHRGKECPERQNLQYTRRHADCNRCGQQGHIQRECPDIWRQFHATTKIGRIVIPEVKVNKIIQCYNCASDSHFGEECEEKHSSYYPLQTVFVCEYDEYARTKPPNKTRGNSRPKHGRQADAGEKSHSHSSELKAHSKQKRQHIIFDSSSSDLVNHHENHRHQNEHSNSKNNRARKEQEFSGSHSKIRQGKETRFHNVNQKKHDKHRTRNETTFHHGSERKRQYEDSEFDHSHKYAKKRTKLPEIVYHNTRKVVLSEPDSSPPKRRIPEFKEPFPRSKIPRSRETVENFDKKRRHDDHSRRTTHRGFQGRYK